MLVAQVGNRFITADIQRADGDAMPGAGLDDLTVDRQLLLFIGHVIVRQVHVFGAKESDPRGPHRGCCFRVGDTVDVGQERNGDMVRGDRRVEPIFSQLIS